MSYKMIKGYNNYLIDEEGNIFNKTTRKYLKGSVGEHGYKYYRLSKNNKKKMFYAHRLVAETFIPNPNNLPVVNHIDGNKINNHIDNLEWTSYTDNSIHAYTLKRKTRRQREYFQENLPKEVWKTINDLQYSISSCGRVRNDKNNLLLKPSLLCGYLKVTLSSNGITKDYMVHKLVYSIFNNLKEIPYHMVVDHIDGNKKNNHLENLRLITISENVLSSFYKTKSNKSIKGVKCYKNGKFIQSFVSIAEAARILSLDKSSITKVCKNKIKTCGGYTFSYVDN